MYSYFSSLRIVRMPLFIIKNHQNSQNSFELGLILFEPSHKIMVLFVLRKLIFQRRMRSHPVGLDVWFLIDPFVYFHTSCMRTAKAPVRLRGCAGSPEPSLVAYVIITIILWAGSFILISGWVTPVSGGKSGRSGKENPWPSTSWTWLSHM